MSAELLRRAADRVEQRAAEAMGPQIASPLAAWLRDAADESDQYARLPFAAVDVARVILGEAS